MRAAAILILVTAVLTGCGLTERLGASVGLGQGRVRSDETVPYAAVLFPSRDAPREFTVSTREVALPLDQLRESIRYPATRYCIETFGSSQMEWNFDAATGDWASVTDGTERVFSGRCTAR